VIEGTGPGVVITDKTSNGMGLFVIWGNNTTVRKLTLTRSRVRSCDAGPQSMNIDQAVDFSDPASIGAAFADRARARNDKDPRVFR
jgi:hypothetical protein